MSRFTILRLLTFSLPLLVAGCSQSEADSSSAASAAGTAAVETTPSTATPEENAAPTARPERGSKKYMEHE